MPWSIAPMNSEVLSSEFCQSFEDKTSKPGLLAFSISLSLASSFALFCCSERRRSKICWLVGPEEEPIRLVVGSGVEPDIATSLFGVLFCGGVSVHSCGAIESRDEEEEYNDALFTKKRLGFSVLGKRVCKTGKLSKRIRRGKLFQDEVGEYKEGRITVSFANPESGEQPKYLNDY